MLFFSSLCCALLFSRRILARVPSSQVIVNRAEGCLHEAASGRSPGRRGFGGTWIPRLGCGSQTGRRGQRALCCIPKVGNGRVRTAHLHVYFYSSCQMSSLPASRLPRACSEYSRQSPPLYTACVLLYQTLFTTSWAQSTPLASARCPSFVFESRVAHTTFVVRQLALCGCGLCERRFLPEVTICVIVRCCDVKYMNKYKQCPLSYWHCK